MRAASSRNAARNSGRTCRLGGTLHPHAEHRQEAGRAQRTRLEPASEHGRLTSAGMQLLGEGEQSATLEVACAGQHHGEPGHEEARARAVPSEPGCRVRDAQRFEQLPFVVAIMRCGEMCGQLWTDEAGGSTTASGAPHGVRREHAESSRSQVSRLRRRDSVSLRTPARSAHAVSVRCALACSYSEIV